MYIHSRSSSLNRTIRYRYRMPYLTGPVGIDTGDWSGFMAGVGVVEEKPGYRLRTDPFLWEHGDGSASTAFDAAERLDFAHITIS